MSARSPDRLAALINAVPVRISGIAPIARAISTAGGILFDEIDENFMLRRKPGVFVAGEMLDWEAPTGGYLLQACFSTGAAAGRGALWVMAQRTSTRRASPRLRGEVRRLVATLSKSPGPSPHLSLYRFAHGERSGGRRAATSSPRRRQHRLNSLRAFLRDRFAIARPIEDQGLRKRRCRR